MSVCISFGRAIEGVASGLASYNDGKPLLEPELCEYAWCWGSVCLAAEVCPCLYPLWANASMATITLLSEDDSVKMVEHLRHAVKTGYGCDCPIPSIPEGRLARITERTEYVPKGHMRQNLGRLLVAIDIATDLYGDRAAVLAG